MMSWGHFFTILAQILILLVVGFVAAAAITAAIRGMRGEK